MWCSSSCLGSGSMGWARKAMRASSLSCSGEGCGVSLVEAPGGSFKGGVFPSWGVRLRTVGGCVCILRVICILSHSFGGAPWHLLLLRSS